MGDDDKPKKKKGSNGSGSGSSIASLKKGSKNIVVVDE